MKILNYLLVALAAITAFATPAHAERGKAAERVWMSGATEAEIIAELRLGSEVCQGSKKNHGCVRANALTREIFVQDVSRPMGANKNVVVNTIMAVGIDGVVIRNEAGVVLARFQTGSENANWQATLQSAFPAAIGGLTNGLGAAALTTFFGPCANGQCQGGGGGSVAYAISGSEANAFLQAMTGGGCPTGGCPAGVAPAPKTDK